MEFRLYLFGKKHTTDNGSESFSTSVLGANAFEDAILKYNEFKDSDFDSIGINLSVDIDCSDITKEELDKYYYEVQNLKIFPDNVQVKINFDIKLDNPEKITNVKLKVQAVICDLPKNDVKLSFENIILSTSKSYRGARNDVAKTVFTGIKTVRTPILHPKLESLSKLYHKFNCHMSGAREKLLKEEFLIVKVADFIGKYVLNNVTECSISGFCIEGLPELMPNAQFYFNKKNKKSSSSSNLNPRMHSIAQERVNKISEFFQAEVTQMPADIINIITEYGVVIPTINAKQLSRVK